MSTITREQLRERAQEKVKSLEFSIKQTAFADSRAEIEEELELARIALASLEAEPVAWLLSGGGAKNNVSFDSGNAYVDPLREVTPLYTAPPAQVAPDEMTPQQASRSYGGEVRGYRDGWNACRAAMLQCSDGVLTNEETKKMDELVMWIKRLAHALRKAKPDSKLQSDAMDYLSRKGLIGVEDILR